jgi:uncharacterized protein YgfB (UPF0149 family)
MQPLCVSDYSRISDYLAHSELQPTPAEAHGMLCGLICGGAPEPGATWIGELLGPAESADLSAQEARGDLRALAERTREEIDGPGLGFTPLLPAEDLPLPERALGLYDWTRGFLYGLAVAGVREADLSEQTREVFADFTGITRMDLDELSEGEDNEEALTELTEFVWVAAMLVYEECGHGEGHGT